MKKKHMVTREEAEAIAKCGSNYNAERLARCYLALLDVVEEQKATIAAMQG